MIATGDLNKLIDCRPINIDGVIVRSLWRINSMTSLLVLVATIPESKAPFNSFFKSPPAYSFTLFPTTDEKIITISNTLKITHSNDGTDPHFQFWCTYMGLLYVAPLLTKLLIVRLTLVLFYSGIKLAKVIEIFKSGDKVNVSNYRSVSIGYFLSSLRMLKNWRMSGFI